jgi:hypothetical protein
MCSTRVGLCHAHPVRRPRVWTQKHATAISGQTGQGRVTFAFVPPLVFVDKIALPDVLLQAKGLDLKDVDVPPQLLIRKNIAGLRYLRSAAYHMLLCLADICYLCF